MAKTAGFRGLWIWAGIPYTGSGALASALAFDKPRCQAVLNAAGVPIASSACVRAGQQGAEGAEKILKIVGLPCVIKPAQGGLQRRHYDRARG